FLVAAIEEEATRRVVGALHAGDLDPPPLPELVRRGLDRILGLVPERLGLAVEVGQPARRSVRTFGGRGRVGRLIARPCTVGCVAGVLAFVLAGHGRRRGAVLRGAAVRRGERHSRSRVSASGTSEYCRQE